MVKYINEFVWWNGKMLGIEDVRLSQFENHIHIYEVLRVIHGVPLFYEEHYERLKSSFLLLGKVCGLASDEIFNGIRNLIQTVQTEGNVMVSFYLTNNQSDAVFGYVPYKYPTTDEMNRGVSVSLFSTERNVPNAKVYSAIIRKRANDIIQKKQVYEVLWVNELEEITEGSRSNVFFVKNNVLCTAPDDKVLCGISRKYILELAKRQQMEVRYELIKKKHLGQMDAAFITGTSPGVLGIRNIDNHPLDINHPFLKSLQDAYQKLVHDYVESHLD